MGDALRTAILEAAAAKGEHGVTMGVIVDGLCGSYAAEQVEHAIWALLSRRLLTPSGFVCRMLQRRGDGEKAKISRSYEMLLVPWSPEDDQQLDLALDSGDDPSAEPHRTTGTTGPTTKRKNGEA